MGFGALRARLGGLRAERRWSRGDAEGTRQDSRSRADREFQLSLLAQPETYYPLVRQRAVQTQMRTEVYVTENHRTYARSYVPDNRGKEHVQFVRS